MTYVLKVRNLKVACVNEKLLIFRTREGKYEVSFGERKTVGVN